MRRATQTPKNNKIIAHLWSPAHPTNLPLRSAAQSPQSNPFLQNKPITYQDWIKSNKKKAYVKEFRIIYFYYPSIKPLKRDNNNTCLGVIMIITNQEETPAAPYVMHSPLYFYDVRIIVNRLISPFLQLENFTKK